MRAVLAALAVIGACASPVDSTTPTPPTVALVAAHCHSVNGLPDSRCTPGAVDPWVTQSNIGTTICHVGYTATIRPPASFTNALKRRQMVEYGETGVASAFEEDHLIALELGGAAKDPRNLWPEPGATPNPKDSVENTLHRQVCAGTVTLADAQHRIAANWRTAITVRV